MYISHVGSAIGRLDEWIGRGLGVRVWGGASGPANKKGRLEAPRFPVQQNDA
jgi:hypothetical protein